VPAMLLQLLAELSLLWCRQSLLQLSTMASTIATALLPGAAVSAARAVHVKPEAAAADPMSMLEQQCCQQ
jgi:hypothetical protein